MKTIRHNIIFCRQATLLFLTVFLGSPFTKCCAQDNTRNYVKTSVRVKKSGDGWLDNIQYVDGLGRPVQNVQFHVTPSKNNLADRIEYDVMGRKSKIWLPIPTTADYVETANMNNDYMGVYHEDTAPFELRTYESWQKGRKTANIGPGQAWAEHPSISSFHTNKSSGVLACKKYAVDESTGTLKEEGFFPSNQLLVQKLTDEDRNEKYVFADAEGRQLLVRRVDGNTYSDVYFVHDLRGNIRYVLQPMFQKLPSIDKFAFRYLYDETNRCIEKQLPGCEKTDYAYDAADRMVMSQTGNQRRTGHKTFYRYDALGRNTYVVERAVGNDSLVTIRKFYDDYSFLDQQGFNSPCFKVSAQRAQGLLTGREVAVYGCDSLLREVNLYDRKGRLTRQIRTNMRGGYDDTSYEYSFTDKLVSKLMVHITANMPTLTQRYEYEYDHADRLKKVTYCLNNAEKKTLREVYYDELGRVGTETIGDIPELGQAINYNIRSCPISRCSPLLEERICYEDATQVFMGSVTPCYNGNICAYSSSVGKPQRGYLWGIGNITRSFSYCYDGLSRLKRVKYKDSDSPDHNYNTNYEYDLQGNLLKLQRNGLCDYDTYGPIDRISMEYDGNQLLKATDPCTDPAFTNALHFADGADQPEEYTYDANGNMTADLNKHIRKISYNTQNLPQEVRFDDGSSIAYLYDADGNKLRTSYAIASYSESMPITQVMHGNVSSQTQQPYMARNSIDYCGSAVYENGKLAYVPIDGGYITFADSTATSAPTFHYYVKDYLGNNRLVVRDDGFGEQMNHYYPFGALMSASTQGAAQRYKYNGKELDRIHGLNLYDYGARQYDAALGRWTSIDPLAEKYYGISPYAYCHDNPINRIDPDGAFDFDNTIKQYMHYGVIAVFPTNLGREEGAIWYDYNEAKSAGVPLMRVDNMQDFANAMTALRNMHTTTETYTLNSHGSGGSFNSPASFYIGTDIITPETDFSSLRGGLSGHFVFIGACNVGNVSGRGYELVENMARQTSSTVIASGHPLRAGYKYDGSNYLNEMPIPYRMDPEYQFNNYIISEKGDLFKPISNVTIDKDKGINWKNMDLFSKLPIFRY